MNWLIILLVGSTMLWISWTVSWNRSLNLLNESSQQQLNQFIEHLNTRLSRYQFLPRLIAKNNLLRELLQDPKNSSRVDLVNHYLTEINSIIGASDTYLMDVNGLTLAASNWDSERPFVGKNFAFRPYFRDAMQGKLGHYFALGTTSAKRGYYFSYPLLYAAEPIGVVVVKMDLSNIEQYWSQHNARFLVHDDQSVIFITTNPDWLFKTLKPLTNLQIQTIENTRRYPGVNIDYLEHRIENSTSNQVLHILDGNASRAYLKLHQLMPEIGWNVQVLTPLDTLKRQSWTIVAIVLLSYCLVILAALAYRSRYKRRLERSRFQAKAQRLLEQEVDRRTADLRHEIQQHQQTESQLKATQNELIQAAKLALLGEMSASISHELNNPLAAIRTYSDNARQFLKIGKNEQVDQNLLHINELTERMAKISSQLKQFARRTTGQLENIPLRKVIMTAIDICKPRFKQYQVDIDIDQLDKNLQVRADRIQLEQVLINLINNAHYAIGVNHPGKICIHTQTTTEEVIVFIDDNGPGIEADKIDHIFEPFYSTRESGMGLGLSISDRIINSMDGKLSAKNRERGGASFAINLPRVSED